tara:strand:+ start:43 stop:225 length:183 start_codon:yes stop_codon:yes gene_type:complete
MNSLYFLEMPLAEMVRTCESIGIDAVTHSELIEEMYWDGFCAAEIKEMIEVLEEKPSSLA